MVEFRKPVRKNINARLFSDHNVLRLSRLDEVWFTIFPPL